MISRRIRLPARKLFRYSSSAQDNEGNKSADREKPSEKTEVSTADINSPIDKLEAAAAEEFMRRQVKIDFKQLKHPTKIPADEVQDPIIRKARTADCHYTKIDPQTLQLLERLSLVELDSKEAFKALEDSVEFAERLFEIDTTGVEPMHSVLEDRPLRTRTDQIADGNIKDDILKNASVTEEDYFIAPPGNIPLEQKEKKFD